MTEPETSAPGYSAHRPDGSRTAYRLLGVAAVLLLASGTVAFHAMEGWSWVDSFYFSAIAGTTVGFGDLTPTTDVSKLFSVLYIFVAVGILGTFLDKRLQYHGVVRRETERVIAKAPDDGQT
jgi:hypothetical protein